MTIAEQHTDALAYHAEGPVWWPDGSGLRWVDLYAGEVLHLDVAGAVHRTRIGDVAAALRPRTSGGFVAGIERGFALVDADGTVHLLPELWTDAGIRMNDGACDPDGRFWCGSMASDGSAGRGALFRLDPDGTTTLGLDGVSISNGLAWSPDGGTAYYVDSPTQRIDAFSYDRDAGLRERRPVVEIPADAGAPDGLTVDAEGCLWVALYGGSAVRRYRPDGALDGVVEVPVGQVTACTFGAAAAGDAGAALDVLYVTTSRENLDHPEPAAGAVFAAPTGVRGMPPAPFAG